MTDKGVLSIDKFNTRYLNTKRFKEAEIYSKYVIEIIVNPID